MTGFGTFDTAPAKRTLMSVTLPDELPADERTWLDTLAERYAHTISGARITQAAPQTPPTTWIVRYDEHENRDPTAIFTYAHASEGLIGYLNASRARFLDQTIESALYAASNGAPEEAAFEVGLEENGRFAARLTIPEGIRPIMSAASVFHKTASSIVTANGGNGINAVLVYGPLTLENQQYRK